VFACVALSANSFQNSEVRRSGKSARNLFTTRGSSLMEPRPMRTPRQNIRTGQK
jgi:hypothetical protein